MKKHQFILILFLVLLYLIFFYFNYSVSKDREVYLSDLNKTIVNINQKIAIDSEDIYPASYLLWGLNRSKLLKERESKIDEKKEKKIIEKEILEKNIKLVKRVICLEKKCWELMGIMSINGVKTLTLLSKEKKRKLQIFKVGEELLPKILIKDIKGESMILLNKEKNREIVLKLFDVNMSQYLPKIIKEKNE